MSKLGAFLNPVATEATRDIVISERFKENGAAVKMTIRAITQEENNDLIKLSTTPVKEKGQVHDRFDKAKYQARLVVACTVSPDFADAELCKRYGAVNPLDVPGRMLFAGEFVRLIEEIMDINGFKDLEEKAEEAKNS